MQSRVKVQPASGIAGILNQTASTFISMTQEKQPRLRWFYFAWQMASLGSHQGMGGTVCPRITISLPLKPVLVLSPLKCRPF